MSPTLLPKYSPNVPLLFSKLAKVHSGFPRSHALFDVEPEAKHTSVTEWASHSRRTVPWNSERVVEICVGGETFALEPARMAHNESSVKTHLR